MRYAVNIPPFVAPAKVLDMALAAEDAGWDAVFVWDHIQWIVDLELDVHDPWGLLSAIAARTERVMLGTAVTPIARRRPWVLGKQIVTLDHLSNGRAIAGIGLGVPDDADFGVFGDEEDPRTRARMTDEALPILDGILRGDHVRHKGEFFDVDARLRPAAVQRPRPPIVIAGTYPYRRPIERALRWDGYFPISFPDMIGPQQVADYLGDIDRPDNWDVFCSWPPDTDVAEFEAAGVTWLVDSDGPEDGWYDRLLSRVKAGPPPT